MSPSTRRPSRPMSSTFSKEKNGRQRLCSHVSKKVHRQIKSIRVRKNKRNSYRMCYMRTSVRFTRCTPAITKQSVGIKLHLEAW